MIKKKLVLSFPEKIVTKPITYKLVKEFDRDQADQRQAGIREMAICHVLPAKDTADGE